jgi:O-antigen/teichoic acid export membrane protein
MLAGLPTQGILTLGGAVIFPALSRVVDRPDFPQLFWRVRLPLVVLGGTLVSGIIASGPYLIRILYDQRYADAGWILQLLAMGAWFQVLEATNSATLLAQGRVSWVAGGNASKLLALVVLIPLGFRLGGFPGALVGLAGADAVRYLVSVLALSGRGLGGPWRDLAFTVGVGAVAAVGMAAGQVAAVGARPALLGFLASGTAAAGLWGVAALFLLRRRPSPEAGGPAA